MCESGPINNGLLRVITLQYQTEQEQRCQIINMIGLLSSHKIKTRICFMQCSLAHSNSPKNWLRSLFLSALQSPIEYQRRESKSNSLGRSMRPPLSAASALRPHSSASIDRHKLPSLHSHNTSLPTLYLPSQSQSQGPSEMVSLRGVGISSCIALWEMKLPLPVAHCFSACCARNSVFQAFMAVCLKCRKKNNKTANCFGHDLQ